MQSHNQQTLMAVVVYVAVGGGYMKLRHYAFTFAVY